MKKTASKVSREFVVVRTKNAGVHCGYLEKVDGLCVTLTEARRVWRWRGANSLNELAANGADKTWTRISEPISKIIITESIEILSCTDESKKNLSVSRWGA